MKTPVQARCILWARETTEVDWCYSEEIIQDDRTGCGSAALRHSRTHLRALHVHSLKQIYNYVRSWFHDKYIHLLDLSRTVTYWKPMLASWTATLWPHMRHNMRCLTRGMRFRDHRVCKFVTVALSCRLTVQYIF